LKIGIAGAGGLGSNIAVHLVRAGVRDFVIADFDRIEESNLNRQFFFRGQIGQLKVEALAENLMRIAPDVRIEAHPVRLTAENIAGIFEGCGIVAEAFDKAEDKAMLIGTLGGAGKKIAAGSGVAGLLVDHVRVRNLGADIAVIGDFVSENTKKPLYSAKVGMVSAMMAAKILEWMGYPDE